MSTQAARPAAVLAGALIAMWCTAAHAQSDRDKAEAATLFDEGMQLFNRGAFAAACNKLEASVALYAGIGNRGKLAECYERDGRTASAWRLYRDVAHQARSAHDDERADIAAERARALEGRLSRLTIDPGPTAGTAGFAIRRGQTAVPARLFHVAVPVDPGSYRVHAVAPGHEPFTATVQIAEAESKTVTVPPLAVAATERGPSARRIAAVSLVSVGAVSLLGSGYSGWSARSEWSRVSAACRDGASPCTPDERAAADESDRRAGRANLFGAIGVAAVVAGAFLWWRSGGERARSGRSVQILPAVGGDQLGVLMRADI